MTRTIILASVMLIGLSDTVAARSAKVRHHSSPASTLSQSTELSKSYNSLGFTSGGTPDDHYHGAPHYHGGPKSIY
jgi:hypothetical protein